MIITSNNKYYPLRSTTLDLQKMRDECNKMLKRTPPEESTIHFHAYGIVCASKRHEQFLNTEGYTD